MMTYHSKSVLLTLAIVGCIIAQSGNAAEEPRLGTIVPEGEMTIFCQKAVAAKFEVQPEDITTDPPIRREGKLLVLGTVDGENDREVGFDCRFEQNGAYLGIIGAPAMND